MLEMEYFFIRSYDSRQPKLTIPSFLSFPSSRPVINSKCHAIDVDFAEVSIATETTADMHYGMCCFNSKNFILITELSLGYTHY